MDERRAGEGETGASRAEDTTGRILDAAQRCLARSGVAKATMEDIGREAGVSRATVYRYFIGRDELVTTVILRQTSRFLERIRPTVERQPSLADALVELLATTLAAARRDPSLDLLFDLDQTREAGGIIVQSSSGVFGLMEEFLGSLFDRYPDQLRPGLDRPVAAEWITRVLLSALTVAGPRPRDPDAWRPVLEQFLIPVVTREASPTGA